MKRHLYFIILTFLIPLLAIAQDPEFENLPKSIKELSILIQNKKYEDVRKIIIERFGPANRDIGSGLCIEQWYFSGGTLTLHPLSGPDYGGIHLIKTTNTVQENLFQPYEMLTLPDTSNHGTIYCIGSLQLRNDSSYEFINEDQFYATPDNFFFQHPSGKFSVYYPTASKQNTVLEYINEGTVIAKIHFTSNNKKAQFSFNICSSKNQHLLYFESNKILSCILRTQWKNRWN